MLNLGSSDATYSVPGFDREELLAKISLVFQSWFWAREADFLV
jgi:aminoglycoside/choline kinase family phosphotransferase